MALEVVNRAGAGVHHQFVIVGDGEEYLLVLAKASFSLSGRIPEPMVPAAIILADEYRGDPTRSSVRYSGELALAKNGPDILITGLAYPRRAGDRSVLVKASVGTWSKSVLVFGDRVWRSTLGVLQPSSPEPIESVPLIFERAFGGVDPFSEPPAASDDNPAGVGFIVRPSARHDGLPVPNLEHPDYLLSSPADRPPPCALGAMAPHWGPRRRLLGTYDERWARTRMPLAPAAGADPRAAQVAPLDQVYPGVLRGGEPVELQGVQPGGTRLAFNLPSVGFMVTVHDGRARRQFMPMLDTVHIDVEALRLDLTWRTSLSVHGWLEDLEWILVDESSRRPV